MFIFIHILVTRIPSRVSSTNARYRIPSVSSKIFGIYSIRYKRWFLCIILYYILIWKNSKNLSPGRPGNRVHIHDILYHMTQCTIAVFDYGNKFGTISFLTELKAPHREHQETSRKQIWLLSLNMCFGVPLLITTLA